MIRLGNLRNILETAFFEPQIAARKHTAKFSGFLITMICLASCQARTPRNQEHVSERPPASVSNGPKDVMPSHDWRTRPSIQVSARAFDGTLSGLEFHSNYLAMNLPFLFMKPVLVELQSRLAPVLISRGEAHVTVLTPPEESVLEAAGVMNSDVDAIATQLNMQQSKLTPICLGVGQAMLNGKLERTYFVVVQADQLREIRRHVAGAQTKASSQPAFEADRFFSHVTIGFTRRDLFEQDGVIKDASSCIYPLELLP